MESKEIVFQRDATREHIKVCLEVTSNPFFPILFQNFTSLIIIFYRRLSIIIFKNILKIFLALFRVPLD